MPVKPLSWVDAIVSAPAETKADITEPEMKSIMKPKFNKPVKESRDDDQDR